MSCPAIFRATPIGTEAYRSASAFSDSDSDSDSAENLLCVVAGPLRVATRTARQRQPKWCRMFDNYIKWCRTFDNYISTYECGMAHKPE